MYLVVCDNLAKLLSIAGVQLLVDDPGRHLMPPPRQKSMAMGAPR